MPIEALDLFSAAAGGWSLGLHRAGFTTIAACEVEPWRRAIYSENNPTVKVYDDVRTLSADRLFRDLGRLPSFVVGSPPCQDISSANTKGKGVEGPRSGLYFEAVRIIGEIRPRWFALENSSNLRTRGADAVIAALEALGYACWPFVVRAGDIGANHERPRCWLIGCDLDQVSSRSAALHTPGIGHEGGRSRGYRTDGIGAAPAVAGHAAHPDSDRKHPLSLNAEMGVMSGMGGDCGRCQSADADQARQAYGSVESCVRQAEIADDGRGARRGNDEPGAGQMGVRAPDRGDAVGGRADWSLADLADHLRVDDGLSVRLAGTRVAVGGPKGTSAASLVVEAFGDAVIPQIPEAIGRAIIRTERALAAIYQGGI